MEPPRSRVQDGDGGRDHLPCPSDHMNTKKQSQLPLASWRGLYSQRWPMNLAPSAPQGSPSPREKSPEGGQACSLRPWEANLTRGVPALQPCAGAVRVGGPRGHRVTHRGSGRRCSQDDGAGAEGHAKGGTTGLRSVLFRQLRLRQLPQANQHPTGDGERSTRTHCHPHEHVHTHTHTYAHTHAHA